MRIFKNTETSYKDIAGEMINIEAGQRLYKNGKKIPEKKQRPYPKIKKDNCTVFPKLNCGFIYVPSNTIFSNFCDKILEQLELMEPESHMSEHSVLNMGTSVFCEVVVNNLTRATSNLPMAQKAAMKRRMLNNSNELTLRQSLEHTRFVWNVIKSDLFGADKSENSLKLLSTIIYDPSDTLIYKNNTFMLKSITFECFKNIKDCMIVYKDKNSRRCIFDCMYHGKMKEYYLLSQLLISSCNHL